VSRHDAFYHADETARMQELEGTPLASFGRRAAAFLLDFVGSALAFMVVAVPIALVYDRLHPGHQINLVFAPIGSEGHRTWYSLLAFCLYVTLSLYFSNGWTPGKRLLGIRVVSTVHRRLSLWHSIERALGYGLSAAEFGFGFLQFFTTPNRRTTHDRVAETIVVRVVRQSD
jgi:uncharacterized RDD family membrane protein YckC